MSKLEEVARTSVKGGFYLLIGNVTSLVLMAIASIIIARLLGPEKYGIYSISFIIPSLTLTLTDFGINPAITRYTAKLRSQNKHQQAIKLAKIGLSFKIITSIITMLIIITLADKLTIILNRKGIENYIRIASLLIIGQVIVTITQNIFLGFDKTEYNALTTTIRAITKLILTPTLIIIGLDIIGALLGHTLSSIITGIISIILVYKMFKSNNNNYNIKITRGLKTLVKYGFPLYLSALITGITNQYNNIVLTWFTTNSEIGNFSVATNFLSLINVLTMPITTTLFPAFSKFDPKKEKSELAELFKYSIKYIALLIVPTAMLVAILSKELVYLVYGHKYYLSPSYLSTYTIYYLLSCIGLFVIRSFLNGIGETKTTFNLSLITTLSMIPLTPILVITWRVHGLIASIIISNLIALIYGIRKLSSKYGIKIELKSSIKLLLATIIATILTTVIKRHINNIILNTVVCTTSYVMICLTIIPLFKILEKQDIKRLEKVLGSIKIIKPIIEITVSILGHCRSR